jgi:hypothetical protein
MPDPLLPDDHAGLLEPSTRQLRLTTGLAPTADVPVSARSKPETLSTTPFLGAKLGKISWGLLRCENVALI